MNKKQYTGILIVLVCLFFLYKITGCGRRVELIDALPPHAAVFMQVSNIYVQPISWDSLAKTNHWNEWPVARQIPQDLRLLQSMHQSAWSPQKREEMAVVPAKGRSEGMDFYYLIKGIHKDLFFSTLSDSVRIKEHAFQQQRVYELTLPSGEKASVAFYKDMLIFARYALYVEDVLSELDDTKGWSKDRRFKKLYASKSADSGVYYYVNTGQLARFLRSLSVPFLHTGAASLAEVVPWWSAQKTTDSTDIHWKGVGAHTMTSEVLACFQKTTLDAGKATHFVRHLPENTAGYSTFGVKKCPFFDALFSEKTQSLLGEVGAFLWTEPFTESLSKERFLVVETAQSEALEKTLFETIAPDTTMAYNGFEIGATSAFAHNFLLWDGEAEKNTPIHFVVLENMLVLGLDLQTMKVLIDQYMVQNTLGKKTSFLVLQEAVSDMGGAQFYLDPLKNAYLWEHWIDSRRSPELHDWVQLLPASNPILANINVTSKSIDFDVVSKKNIAQEGTASTVWRCRLGADAATEPMLVSYKKEPAMLVQDVQNTLYLINKNGKIIWKRPFLERIQSRIYELDFYQNGTTNYLFNTPSKVFLIDDLGKNIHSYPIDLQSNATNGLIAIDFDHTGKYDYFVACRNGNIYGFDQYGRPLSGWNPNFNKGTIVEDFQHFQYGNKDYIVSLRTNGRLQVFQRNGKYRFDPILTDQSVTVFFENNARSTRIVAPEANGKVRVVNSEGKSFRLAIADQKGRPTSFCLADALGDARKDYFMLYDSLLYAKYYTENNFEPAFQYTYTHPQDSLWEVRFSKKEKASIGSLSRSKKQINLINSKGELYPDFPLAGTTAFQAVQLFGASQKMIVVGYDNSVVAYQLGE